MKRLILAIYPAAILGIMFALFLHNVMRPESTLNIYPDNEWFLGSVFSFASGSIRDLDWPLWMNTILGGVPLYNSPQISAYYPFYFLYLDVFRTPLDSINTLHNITLLHVAIFQINAYILLRTLRVSREAAFVGVVFIVFNLSTLEVIKWGHLIASYSWTPLYLAGLVRSLERPHERSGILMTIISFVMMSYAMVGQPLILAALFTVCIVLSYAIKAYFAGNKVQSLISTRYISATLIVAIFIAAPVILPVVTGLHEMIRWVASDQAIIGNAPIPFDKFLTDQLSLNEIPSFLFNLGNRHDIANPFIGLLPILFALIAIRQKDRHWIVIPLALIAGYSFVSSFGSNLGLAYVNYHIPILNKIREPSYFLLPFNISIGVLAAFGVDFLLKCGMGNVKATISKSSWLVWLLGLSILLSVIVYAQTHTANANIVIPLALFIFALGGYRWIKVSSSLKKASTIVIVTLSIVMQFMFVSWTSPTFANSDYLRLDLFLLETALSRVKELDPDHEYRVVFGRDVDSQKASMLASYQGIRTLNSYINPLPVKQFNEMYYFGPRGDKYSKALGAKYLICKQCYPEDVSGYTLKENIAGYSIYVAEESLPHTYISNYVLGKYTSLNDYISKISTSNLASKPLLFETANPPVNVGGNQEVELRCTKKIDHHSLNRIVYITSCNLPAVFVLNEFFTDSWKVSVDGKELRPYKVNGNQIGVPIAAGSHFIEFKYSPGIVRYSMVLFIIGSFGLILLLIFAPRIQAADRKSFWVRGTL
jgi:hypothetical protein